MTQSVSVRYLIAGTVAEETWMSEKILTQHFPDGRACITLVQGGRAVEYVTYRLAERVHRVVVPEAAP